MFTRKWRLFGSLISDEGFKISYAHKSVLYRDARGKFEFGYEDGMLSGTAYQVDGEKVSLSQEDVDQMVDRVVRGLRADGHTVDAVYRQGRPQVLTTQEAIDVESPL